MNKYKNVKIKCKDPVFVYLLNARYVNTAIYIIFDIENWQIFYNKNITIVSIQTNIHNFVDHIINKEATNSPEITIVHENYIQLTEEERNYIIELGYTLIDYII